MTGRKTVFLGTIIIIAVSLIALVILSLVRFTPQTDNTARSVPLTTTTPSLTFTPVATMTLSSPDFSNNEPIPEQFSCKGQNLNPGLLIGSVPEDAQALALVLSDPDAPNGTFFHWLFWNLDPGTKEIKSGIPPADIVTGVNGAGKNDYTGPCPPSGTHHYNFTLYALDTKLELSSNSDAGELLQAMQGHVLSQATLTGLFSY